jgi:hypothetical protein
MDSVNTINEQVLEKYTCIFKNIGTEDNCLIQEDAYNLLNQLDSLYELIINKYVSLFYNKRFNSFVYNSGNEIMYDKFVSNFISEHNLLNKKEKFETIYINNEDYGEQFPITYEMSFYGRIEDRDIEELDYIRYDPCPITYQHSVFLYYNAKNVRTLAFVPDHVGPCVYIRDELIDYIKENNIENVNNIIEELLIKYFNDSIESIFQIDINKLKEYKIKYTMTDYIMVPMLLFILQYYSNRFLHM